MRLLPLLRARYRVFAVTRDIANFAALRAAGAVPVLADLDRPASLRRLAGLAQRVIHLAPPPGEGELDTRTRNVTAILPEAAKVVYVSTTGVYGDLQGRLVDESQPVAPRNIRARRRVDAEGVLRAWARRAQGRLSILRVPGIYAADRLPLERLRQGTPALEAADDVYTNHIHADDLAALLLAALRRGKPLRVYHAVDDSEMRMAEYFDAVADAFGLQRPPRLPRAQLARVVSPTLLSFMSESRRLANGRSKRELGMILRYPTVAHGLQKMTAVRQD
ncbi:sugar nucleotide-binding protein [Massilia sp. METH4]|uniref:sugar nucleotide-binding protein n=1 Tax=Massilia sp. METH4 TaxID=3123041 RepID=UPI0030CF98DF